MEKNINEDEKLRQSAIDFIIANDSTRNRDELKNYSLVTLIMIKTGIESGNLGSDRDKTKNT